LAKSKVKAPYTRFVAKPQAKAPAPRVAQQWLEHTWWAPRAAGL